MHYYDIAALIYRFYGVPITVLAESVNVADYYCMYALSLDADEIDRYERSAYAGGDVKNWQWSHPDLARKMNGKSRPKLRVSGEEARGRTNIERAVQGFFNKNAKKGSAALAMQAMGEQLVILEQDEHGNNIIPDGYVFVPADASGINPENGLPFDIPLPDLSGKTPRQIDNKRDAIVHSLQGLFNITTPENEGGNNGENSNC